MREIKFRGRISQGLENAGHWVYWGINGTDMLDALDSDTIGQCTGLYDDNFAEIFEGDIVEQVVNCMFDKGKHNQKVAFNGKDQFVSGNCSLYQAVESFRATVIGNIYENPELLKEGK